LFNCITKVIDYKPKYCCPAPVHARAHQLLELGCYRSAARRARRMLGRAEPLGHVAHTCSCPLKKNIGVNEKK